MVTVEPKEPPRPRTPDHLRVFVTDLYEGRCLRCGRNRPFAVAHLLNWPTIRNHLKAADRDIETFGFWTFHQPSNMVLLCCNCHTLFDSPHHPDVNLAGVAPLRDAARRRPGFPEKVRAFVCREMGRVRRRNVDMATLAPLTEWLREAVDEGLLSPPHRFVVPWGAGFWLADLGQDVWEFVDVADPALPVWDGRTFEG